jgi:hypothetical protein
VGAAPQLNIAYHGQSTGRVRRDVMELEKRRFRAPPAIAGECTTALIALPHFTPDSRRNVARPTVCAADVFGSGFPDRGAPPPFEIGNQQRQCTVEHRGHVAVRNFVAEEILRGAELGVCLC